MKPKATNPTPFPITANRKPHHQIHKMIHLSRGHPNNPAPFSPTSIFLHLVPFAMDNETGFPKPNKVYHTNVERPPNTHKHYSASTTIHM
ncbi:hypothetical protein M758_10G063200 [Ceratodon purpureus]|nr:hypothetical protein M758_10G063200 [Ceratodon purpureus]